MKGNEKGSAVIMVILVVLVLTMVGLSALIYMSLEQNLSLSDRLAKEALYISEVGMRQGEALVAQASLADINTMLAYPDTHSDIPTSVEECNGTGKLGAVYVDLATGTKYWGTKPAYYSYSGGFYAVYDLYIRNNADDPSGDPLNDADNIIKLVCVGEIYKGGPPLIGGVPNPNAQLIARKIVEEALSTGVLSGYSGQKGGSAVGAGSAYKKG